LTDIRHTLNKAKALKKGQAMKPATSREGIIKAILKQQEITQNIRKRERIGNNVSSYDSYELNDSSKELSGMAQFSAEKSPQENLVEFLRSFMPIEQIPTNVGRLETVLWPKWYQVDFLPSDNAIFGTNPTYSPNILIRKSFRTVQDAGFLLLGLARNYSTNDSAGKGAPLEFLLRDDQSMRQLGNNPSAVQCLGSKATLTNLSVPYYLPSNASVSIELSTFIENDMVGVGDGRQFFTFFGLEVRNSELDSILQTAYSV
jgi:hypothetical protein